jgi:F-type H+-transporting ATPase subunit c
MVETAGAGSILDYKVALALAMPFAFGFAALGAGLGLGRAVGAAMEAIGRQPEAATKILIYMAVGCAFIDTIAIFGMLVVFSFLK